MRYVFIGAGAVGSALGGLLAQHDTEVLLVARGEHGRAMAEHGVTLRCPDTTMTVSAPVVTTPEQARLTVDDVLVLTTKTHQAEAAVGAWSDTPVHGPDGGVAGRAGDLLPILTALNGVASEEIALLDRVAQDWTAAGCPIRRPEAVMEWLLANVGNVLQALLGDTSGAEDIAQAAEAEARETLLAAGIGFVGDEQARDEWQPEGLSVRPVPGEPAQLGGSTWQSMVRGSGSIETDYLNGEISLVARRTGRAAPINTRLTALARRAARDGLRPGSIGLDELRAELHR